MAFVTYRCNDCEQEFEEPKQITDWVEFWGQNVPMYSYVCPFCGSDDYEEKDDEEEDDDREST